MRKDKAEGRLQGVLLLYDTAWYLGSVAFGDFAVSFLVRFLLTQKMNNLVLGCKNVCFFIEREVFGSFLKEH